MISESSRPIWDDQDGLKGLVGKLMKFVKKSDEISSVSGVPLLPIFKRCHHHLCPISISWESERYFDQTKFNWPVKFSEVFDDFTFLFKSFPILQVVENAEMSSREVIMP